MNQKPAYSVKELLEFHPAGRAKVYKDIADGRLIARKDGDLTVILHTDYIAYLEALPKVQPKRDEAGA